MSIDLTLPMPADRLIPHRPPMILVDTLLSHGEGTGTLEACPGADCLLADHRGELDRVYLIELIAQGYAAFKGYDDLVHGRQIQEGFLVGIRKLRLAGTARVGDRLRVTIRTVGAFEGFAVVDGTVTRDGEVLASGTIKLWLVNDAGGRGAA